MEGYTESSELGDSMISRSSECQNAKTKKKHLKYYSHEMKVTCNELKFVIVKSKHSRHHLFDLWENWPTFFTQISNAYIFPSSALVSCLSTLFIFSHENEILPHHVMTKKWNYVTLINNTTSRSLHKSYFWNVRFLESMFISMHPILG